MPGAAGAPMGAPGGPAGKPKVPMPGSISGGPSGPGASSLTPPGAGGGNEAMADSVIKALIPALHKALSAYQIGSKKYNSVINALRALTSNFGKENQESTVPAALLQLSQASRGAMPQPKAPPPPIQPVTQKVPGLGLGGPGAAGGGAAGLMGAGMGGGEGAEE
jgi:hypothetical protein